MDIRQGWRTEKWKKGEMGAEICTEDSYDWSRDTEDSYDWSRDMYRRFL